LGSAWLTAGGTGGKQIPTRLQDALRELSRDSHDLGFMYKNPDRDRILTERARSLGVYDWLLERSAGLFGTTTDVRGRLQELAGRGLTNWVLNLRGVGLDRLETVRLVGSEVLVPLSDPT
jgi:hypothetical protein